ncbi:uncharacterized protein B0H64DRAFT_409635 [Chaetomium fimeti]|uniref:Uncharacterized protein n=1 Tax=Chaetomium fimeti TaxID=1854472 RepID=A0AAE0H9W0_9PEZI|nr:hypothetical protein B0H64DRAFT_409635 [Chaetomium fimeti]
MSYGEARRMHTECGRLASSVPPRSKNISHCTSYRPCSPRYSNTMDYDDPMMDAVTHQKVTASDASGDQRRQEVLLLELKRVNQDMAGIQNGLNCLMQQVEAIPAQVVAGMGKPGASGENGWRNWFLGANGYPEQQSYEQASSPLSQIGGTRFAEPHGESKVLGTRNIALQRELDAVKRELAIAQRKNLGLEGQLRENQEQVNKLRGKEAMFRTIILDQAGVQKISDDEILQGFLKLRQDIQKLSRSPSYVVDTNPVLATGPQGTTSSLASFYRASAWGTLGLVDRRLRMRAKIFDVLHFHILGYNCFGLQGFQTNEAGVLGQVEPGLRRFEYTLTELGVSENVISDWRIATINCVELTGIEDATSERATTDIFSLLAPLLSKHIRQSEEEVLRSSILSLCKDAYKLRMMMRKSKDIYAVEKIGLDGVPSLSALESKADPIAVENGKNSERSDEIAYTMFGALTKQPEGEGQPMKVLEKAQVVLRKR